MKTFRDYNKLILIMLLFGFFFMSVNVYAERTVNVGTYEFPPFLEFKNGEPGGIWVELLKKVLDRCKIRYSIEEYPAKRVVKNIVEGQTDILMAAKGISPLEENAVYSRSAFTNVEVSVYTRKDTAVPGSKEELRGKNIITVRGYSYGGLIKYLENPENKITLDPSDSNEMLFKKLRGKRADYAITYTTVADTILKKVMVEGIQSNPISNFDVFFIVSKKTPDCQKLMDDMERAFNQLKDEGKL